MINASIELGYFSRRQIDVCLLLLFFFCFFFFFFFCLFVFLFLFCFVFCLFFVVFCRFFVCLFVFISIFFFPRKHDLTFHANLYGMSTPVLEKNKKKYLNCRLLKLLLGVLSVKEPKLFHGIYARCWQQLLKLRKLLKRQSQLQQATI